MQYLVCLLAVSSATALHTPIFAQQTSKKIVFGSINLAGLITASNGEAALFQTVNGITKNKSFAGIGLGLDFYGYKTVPLFLDYRRDLFVGKNTPFAYADAGVNFLWLNFIQREQKSFPDPSPAAFYDVGVGWKLRGKNSRSFLVSAGYSMKQVKYKVQSHSISSIPQLQADNFDRYLYTYRRVVLKIGFQL